jgi:hypothetical protein
LFFGLPGSGHELGAAPAAQLAAGRPEPGLLSCYPNWACVMRARKNSPSACRLVPCHHPAVNRAGMVIPPKAASAWTDTPVRWNAVLTFRG